MHDRYADGMRRLREAVLQGAGTTDPQTREAAANGGTLPDALATYARTVHEHAYRVTDANIAALQAAGYSEDQIFEVTISAALGAALARLEPGLAAIQAAEREPGQEAAPVAVSDVPEEGE